MSRSDRPWPIQGNTTGGPLAAAAHWLCKGLTAYNPSDRHPVLSAGPQVYHSDPARRSWRETCRGPLRSGWVRAARFLSGKRESLGAGGVCRPRVMALSPVRSRPRECTCCAGYSVFKVPPGQLLFRGLLFALHNTLAKRASLVRPLQKFSQIAFFALAHRSTKLHLLV